MGKWESGEDSGEEGKREVGSGSKVGVRMSDGSLDLLVAQMLMIN